MEVAVELDRIPIVSPIVLLVVPPTVEMVEGLLLPAEMQKAQVVEGVAVELELMILLGLIFTGIMVEMAVTVLYT